MSDLNGLFKITNLTVGGLSVIAGSTQLLSGVAPTNNANANSQSFFLGLYLILLGAGVVLLEFKIPPAAYTYASFAFSFLGRGVAYFLLSVLIAHGHAVRIVLGSLVAIVGLVYAALEFVDSVEAPENLRSDPHVLADEEDVI